MRAAITKNSALVIVDVQIDFMPGGRLPVPNGDEIIPALNEFMGRLSSLERPVLATRDWHPENHMSFEPTGPWPPHCIQGSTGAEFHPNLRLPVDAIIISKGTDPSREAYSGFERTELEGQLRAAGATRLFVGGVATEYCVKETVLDALERGFEVFLLQDAIRGVSASDSEKAFEEMVRPGAVLVASSEVL